LEDEDETPKTGETEVQHSTAALTITCSICVLSAILSAFTRSLYSRVSTAAEAAAAKTRTRPVRRPC